MTSDSGDRFGELREAVRALCGTFPPEYWRELDEQRAYPEAFVKALTQAGWLSALIPEEYGGSGLGLTEASVILEEVNGQKVWTSRLQHSDLMLLLARTTPLPEVKQKSEGLSVFLVDLHCALGKGITVRPIRNMPNHETNEVFFDNLEVPAENLIGEEGKGFRYILDGMNAARILIAAECVGDGYWFLAKARDYARDRIVFDRPIGQNQGVQFPIARAYVSVEAANLILAYIAEHVLGLPRSY